MLLLIAGKAETEVVVPEGRIGPEAERRAAALRIAVPAAAPEQTAVTTGRARGIGNRIGGINAIPVLAPFIDVAMHVVEAEGVGRVRTN